MRLKPLAKHAIRRNIQAARIQELLLALGFKRKDLYLEKYGLGQIRNNRRSFWQRNEHRLEFMLHDAHIAYRDLIKASHPDRGGCAKRAASLNQAWQRVKKLFAQKGVRLN